MQFSITRFVQRVCAELYQRLSVRNPDPEFNLLDDEIPFEEPRSLSDDLKFLRNLEAEVYVLNDQLNTELGKSGATTL